MYACSKMEDQVNVNVILTMSHTLRPSDFIINISGLYFCTHGKTRILELDIFGIFMTIIAGGNMVQSSTSVKKGWV